MTGNSQPIGSSLDNRFEILASDITSCRRCPRLVAWREKVASERRASFRDELYWGKPVPGLGDESASLLVVGLAPAAHGANRTGRMFTGDRSGDWLFGALRSAGFASQPPSGDTTASMQLCGAYLTAVVRCAPPANKPSSCEKDACVPFLVREMELLANVRVVVALGHFAYEALAKIEGLRPRPKFAHGREIPLDTRLARAGNARQGNIRPSQASRPSQLSRPAGIDDTIEAQSSRAGTHTVAGSTRENASVSAANPGGRTLICSYHPSQQNTFTGKLTRQMLDAIFERARALVAEPARPALS